jgi:chemotaxis protein methyltransferase CheR
MARRPKVEAPNDLEAIEIECFLLALFRRYGYDLRGYNAEYVQKLVTRSVRDEEVESITRLSELLLRQPEVMERFLAHLSSPEESLFQPADFWGAFREKVLPFLRTYPSLRFWLIGAKPEELYSLSILVEEELPRHVRIYATDIHETLLDRARGGTLPSDKVTKGVKAYRQSGGRKSLNRYFDKQDGSAVFSQELRKKIVFAAHNPVTDGTFQQCHVIMARNGLELLNEDLRSRTYRLLHESMVSLGFLALGPKDDLGSSPMKECYKEVDRSANLFQKVRE